MSKMGIIIKDVYKKNVKSTAFLIMILAPFFTYIGDFLFVTIFLR